ncbi:PAS domain S-box protein [Archangium violaceum]|uniref:sensor histidine kinase n=1 Tax=Archangium violaceum TaxID=83451 RepID=UPI001950D425|nr:ATP-binding protein [Archangium violaceum]QRN94947.1 PAS domain S-box protein [Archangium violaceum]
MREEHPLAGFKHRARSSWSGVLRRFENMPIRLKLLLGLSLVGLLPVIALSSTEIARHGGLKSTEMSLPSLLLSIELVLALLCAGGLARLLIRPLSDLQQYAESLLAGKQARIDLERGDEIGRLARSFARLLAERQRAEDSLRESEERFRIIFEQAGVGIAQVSREGRFVLVNPKLCDILGYTAEELRELTWAGITYPEDLPASLAQRQLLEEPGTPSRRWEKRYIRKDGAVVWANLSSVAMHNPAGRIECFISVLQDITEHKRAEEERNRLYREAQEAIRARDVFLSVASHELKTPLTSLQLSLQQGLRGLRHQELVSTRYGRELTHLGLAEQQARRLGALINELLDVSQLATRGPELNLERVDLAELAREVVRREEARAARLGSKLVLETRGPVEGWWDTSRLEQVLLNLLSNAIKFGEGKPIEVKVDADAELAMLDVRDQGIGISPEAQSRIFERFERAVPERHYGGLGLGLWIARQIVHAHGGSLWVESTEGQGTTFHLRLPKAGLSV